MYFRDRHIVSRSRRHLVTSRRRRTAKSSTVVRVGSRNGIMRGKPLFLALLALSVIAIAGCGASADPQAALRQQVLLADPPDAPRSITEAKAEATTDSEVTLIGRIDAGDFDPFDPQVAAFMLSEIPSSDHDHGDGQTADNCPFCKRRAAQAPKAHVTLIDRQEQPLTTPASRLLGLEKGDQVIVRGRANWNEQLNVLEVKSSGIYPLR